MIYSVIKIILFAFLLLSGPVGLRAAEEGDIVTQPAQSKAAPQDNETPAQPVPPAKKPAIFSLTEPDILSWEESGEGKYLYFTLTDEKNEELEKLTNEKRGEPLKVVMDNVMFYIPAITNVMDQKNGFVLMIPEEHQRRELMVMLGWEKEQPATTQISTTINMPAKAAEKKENP